MITDLILNKTNSVIEFTRVVNWTIYFSLTYNGTEPINE